jgi:hypothetical protein
MPKFYVSFAVYATSQSRCIEANSAEEAKAKLEDSSFYCAPTLCWQCADELEVGDPGEIFVSPAPDNAEVDSLEEDDEDEAGDE